MRPAQQDPVGGAAGQLTRPARPVTECTASRVSAGACAWEGEMGELSISSHDRHGILRLVLRGELQMHTVDQLRTVVARTLPHHRGVDVRMDLAGVSFVDSSGVSALLGTMVDVEEAGGRMSVITPQPAVYRTLRVLGLLEALHVNLTPDGNGGGESDEAGVAT